MIVTKNLIRELKRFPEDSRCFAYEGEIIGVVVTAPDGKDLGYIEARESGKEDSLTAITRGRIEYDSD